MGNWVFCPKNFLFLFEKLVMKEEVFRYACVGECPGSIARGRGGFLRKAEGVRSLAISWKIRDFYREFSDCLFSSQGCRFLPER